MSPGLVFRDGSVTHGSWPQQCSGALTLRHFGSDGTAFRTKESRLWSIFTSSTWFVASTMLDPSAYPHILDGILGALIAEGNYGGLLRLRATTRALADHIDALLFKHISIHFTPSRALVCLHTGARFPLLPLPSDLERWRRALQFTRVADLHGSSAVDLTSISIPLVRDLPLPIRRGRVAYLPLEGGTPVSPQPSGGRPRRPPLPHAGRDAPRSTTPRGTRSSPPGPRRAMSSSSSQMPCGSGPLIWLTHSSTWASWLTSCTGCWARSASPSSGGRAPPLTTLAAATCVPRRERRPSRSARSCMRSRTCAPRTTNGSRG